MSDATIKLSEADAGTLCATDAMRDDEQHGFIVVSEQLLYLHVRAALTKMREAARELDMDAIWQAHRPGGKEWPPRSSQGCQAS